MRKIGKHVNKIPIKTGESSEILRFFAVYVVDSPQRIASIKACDSLMNFYIIMGKCAK